MDEIKEYTQSSEENRKGLSVPYELILYHQCKRSSTMPFEGGYLDQPHYLLLCFEIIEREEWEWAEALRRMEQTRREINERLQQAMKK